MAKFITISGPSATGKTTIFNELRNHAELSNVIFVSDIFSAVWDDLVERKLFSEFEDVSRDPELLCVFVQKIITHYRESIDHYKNTDKLVILDSCWIDLSIYSVINMWYSHILKDLQESLLAQLSEYDNYIDRIYITSFDESKQKIEKYRNPFRRYNVKHNRGLELQYYKLASHFKNAVELPSTEIDEIVPDIIEDLKELGYL